MDEPGEVDGDRDGPWSTVDRSSVCGEVTLRATSSGSVGARGSRAGAL
ncbi:hypothetical protein [Sorangium sp. So ce341]